MSHKNFADRIVILAFLAFSTSLSFATPVQKVLHTFCSSPNCADGSLPLAGVVIDSTGNIYGTTSNGGRNGWGTVFKLSPGAGGVWTETVLYDFCSLGTCLDGQAPSAGLAIDAAGKLYGTTSSGGLNGGGTVFEMTPSSGGSWGFATLYNFCGSANCADGENAINGVTLDAGNIYGVTNLGGAAGYGLVFKLAVSTGGTWTETVLLNFTGANGKRPNAELTFDSHGNLYGTTSQGGTHIRYGTVFKLVPHANGSWAHTVVYNFAGGVAGGQPTGKLTLDSAGNLYGTASYGGANSVGIVFQLSFDAGGGVTETVVHSFNGNDGGNPQGAAAIDAKGNLYALGFTDGLGEFGSVIKLSPTANGWNSVLLHSFTGGNDGGYPGVVNLAVDKNGHVYGTTPIGGKFGWGVVFEIIP